MRSPEKNVTNEAGVAGTVCTLAAVQLVIAAGALFWVPVLVVITIGLAITTIAGLME